VTVIEAIRDQRLDAELAGLLWLLAEGRVPIHLAVPTVGGDVAAAVRELAADPAAVTESPGVSIEEVLRQPVPLRPATGAIVIVDVDGRVASAHLLRPPLRDGAGHIRSQGPAVLAARIADEDRLEHFAWGILPELAIELGKKAGDVETELDQRATFLQGLAAASPGDPVAVRNALHHWSEHGHGSH
jgi:hypothetical protein